MRTIGKLKSLAFVAVSTIILAGCCSSPYDYVDYWLIREDPTLTFSVNADVIYIQDELYLHTARLPSMYARAKVTVGNGRFEGVARVFSPLVTSADDVEMAVKWYLKNHHERKRPFAFIGEGEGGRFLWAYEQVHSAELKEAGFIGGFYTDETDGKFVNDEIVHKIRDVAMRVRYRNIWGREMPTK